MTTKHTLVIDQFGDYIGLESQRLVIKSEDSTKHIPIDEIESVLFTNPQNSISLKALCTLLQSGAGISILNRNQVDICSVSPKPAHALRMNKIQHQWRSNGVGCQLAKKMILDKAWHQKHIVYEMMRRARFKTLDQLSQKQVQKAYTQIDRDLNYVKNMILPDQSYEQSLFTQEAKIAKAYWQAVAAWLPVDLGFDGRKLKGDTPNPFNAALNYGYAILASRITHQLSGLGFDPHLGFLHADQTPRTSLTYDIIERYRQRYVDACLLRYSLTHQAWTLDEKGYLPKAIKQEVSELILHALDPRTAEGMSMIIEDCQTLRQALLSHKTWKPLANRRKGLAPS